MESVQNCVEGAHKVVAQMRDCSMSEKEEKWDMMAEVELGEMMMLWVAGQRDLKIEFWTLMNKVVTLEHQKMEREF